MKTKADKILYKICPLLSVAAFLAVWAIAAAALNVEFLLPSPESVARDLINAFGDKKFYASIGVTLWHALASYVAAFAAAALFAGIASFFKAAEYFLYPLVVIMRVMPTIAVIFLSIVWLSGNKAPFLICFFVCFPLLYSQFLSAIKGVNKGLLQMAKVYRLSKFTIITRIYLPEIYSQAIEGAASVLSFSVKITVAGEAVSQAAGSLGFMISSANANLETGLLIAYALVAVLLGFLFEGAVKLCVFAFKKRAEKIGNTRAKKTENGGDL